MLLEALFAAASTMIGLTIILFLIYFFRTYSNDDIKKMWANAKRRGQHKYDTDQKILGYKKEGLKEFTFDNGRVSVWAKNQFQANYMYETGKCKLSARARKQKQDKKKAKKNRDLRAQKN